MDGDGEDSVDFSSDGDVVGDATMPVLNVLAAPSGPPLGNVMRVCGVEASGLPHSSFVSLDSRSTS